MNIINLKILPFAKQRERTPFLHLNILNHNIDSSLYFIYCLIILCTC